MEFIKNFISYKIKYFNFKQLLLRIPFYIILELILLIFVDKSGIFVPLIASNNIEPNFKIRIQLFIFRIVFYSAPPLILTIFDFYYYKGKFFKYLIIEQYNSIFLIFVFSFIVNSTSLPNENSKIFQWGTTYYYIGIICFIDFIEYRKKLLNK